MNFNRDYKSKKTPFTDGNDNRRYYEVAHSVIPSDWYEDKVARTYQIPSNIDFFLTEEAKARGLSKSDELILILYEYIMNTLEEQSDATGLR